MHGSQPDQHTMMLAAALSNRCPQKSPAIYHHVTYRQQHVTPIEQGLVLLLQSGQPQSQLRSVLGVLRRRFRKAKHVGRQSAAATHANSNCTAVYAYVHQTHAQLHASMFPVSDWSSSCLQPSNTPGSSKAVHHVGRHVKGRQRALQALQLVIGNSKDDCNSHHPEQQRHLQTTQCVELDRVRKKHSSCDFCHQVQLSQDVN